LSFNSRLQSNTVIIGDSILDCLAWNPGDLPRFLTCPVFLSHL
jgi:hypothetical protein